MKFQNDKQRKAVMANINGNHSSMSLPERFPATAQAHKINKMLKQHEPITKEHKGTFFYGGKAYHVELTPNHVLITDRFQDSDNKWHTGKLRLLVKGDDMKTLEKEANGLYTNKIIEYLDRIGGLRPDSLLKNRIAYYDLAHKNFTEKELDFMSVADLGTIIEKSKDAMLGETVLLNENKLDYKSENDSQIDLFRSNYKKVADALERRSAYQQYWDNLNQNDSFDLIEEKFYNSNLPNLNVLSETKWDELPVNIQEKLRPSLKKLIDSRVNA